MALLPLFYYRAVFRVWIAVLHLLSCNVKVTVEKMSMWMMWRVVVMAHLLNALFFGMSFSSRCWGFMKMGIEAVGYSKLLYRKTRFSILFSIIWIRSKNVKPASFSQSVCRGTLVCPERDVLDVLSLIKIF
jgi:hypothetical protein